MNLDATRNYIAIKVGRERSGPEISYHQHPTIRAFRLRSERSSARSELAGSRPAKIAAKAQNCILSCKIDDGSHDQSHEKERERDKRNGRSKRDATAQ